MVPICRDHGRERTSSRADKNGKGPLERLSDEPREFDGWLKANAFVGSIVALVILSMALAALYSGGGLNEIELSSADRLSSRSH